tara:strand:+ start:635 stop:1075 length:441 start_codon:yes stop_codon:yes gene_type:complete
MSKELPYFKSFPEQWLSGDINFESFELQGAFTCAKHHYWANNCSFTYDKMLLRLKNNKDILDELIKKDYIVLNNDKVHIKFLDEQYKESQELHKKRVKNGSKGGSATAKLKQGYSNTEALRKEKIKKDNTPYLSTKGLNEYLSTKK